MLARKNGKGVRIMKWQNKRQVMMIFSNAELGEILVPIRSKSKQGVIRMKPKSIVAYNRAKKGQISQTKFLRTAIVLDDPSIEQESGTRTPWIRFRTSNATHTANIFPAPVNYGQAIRNTKITYSKNFGFKLLQGFN